ncbi:hypothetical protein JW948_13655 [bacterium]|nr:hypothetical protein [bacterium]
MGKRIFMTLTAGCLLILPLFAQNDFVMIINKNIQETSINRSSAESIFLGKKSRWTDGTKIVPVTLKEGELHESFIREIVKKSTNAYMNYWRKMIFTGKGVMPVSFDNEKDLIEYVGRTDGAIGYVSSGTNLQESDGVKPIQVTE